MDTSNNIGKNMPTITSSMDPMMPSLDPNLLTLSVEVSRRIGELKAKLNAITATELASLLGDMNSYYSNLIEGHKTYPKDIERALASDFSSNLEERQKQFLGKANVLTEREALALVAKDSKVVFTSDFLLALHKIFYENLPEEMRIAKSKSGTEYQIKAGEFRDFEVEVGTHQPPLSSKLPTFMDRFFNAYKNLSLGEILIASAASHHRLTWIHPFGDGNGRVVRIYTNAFLKAFGLDGNGIWSLSRGLARRRNDYYSHLAKADADRHGDLDGRGALSNKGLNAFCTFFLETMLDQMDFMLSLLDLDKLTQRYTVLLRDKFPKNPEAYLRILKEIWTSGEVKRGSIKELSGKSERTSRTMISELEKAKLVKSLSPKSPLRIKLNADTSEYIFPKLFMQI